jgi:hypothetical protein
VTIPALTTEEALISYGIVTKTANTATAPPDPGAPEFLYAVSAELATTLAHAAMVAAIEIPFNTLGPARRTFDAGTVILDAKVYVDTPFNAGTTNQLILGAGSVSGAINPPRFVIANAYDVALHGGAPVTGSTENETDTPQFLPVVFTGQQAVYVEYAQTGAAASQGNATVWVTYLQGGAG